MPLPRLSDAQHADGTVPIGALSKRVRLEELNQEVWAKVSIAGREAQITIPYMPGVKVTTSAAYENRRFRIERVIPLGLDVQIRLECTEVSSQ
jgi:hypothetical protein